VTVTWLRRITNLPHPSTYAQDAPGRQGTLPIGGSR